MANLIGGKTWALDSVNGLVTSAGVIIHAINITWNTASAGSVVLTTNDSTDQILMAETIALASGNRGQLTQQFSMGDQCYMGFRKLLTVGITSIHVITGLPR